MGKTVRNERVAISKWFYSLGAEQTADKVGSFLGFRRQADSGHGSCVHADSEHVASGDWWFVGSAFGYVIRADALSDVQPDSEVVLGAQRDVFVEEPVRVASV